MSIANIVFHRADTDATLQVEVSTKDVVVRVGDILVDRADAERIINRITTARAAQEAIDAAGPVP